MPCLVLIFIYLQFLPTFSSVFSPVSHSLEQHSTLAVVVTGTWTMSLLYIPSLMTPSLKLGEVFSV